MSQSVVAADVVPPEEVSEELPETASDTETVDDALLDADLLIEDVSIDGMCGVY